MLLCRNFIHVLCNMDLLLTSMDSTKLFNLLDCQYFPIEIDYYKHNNIGLLNIVYM